MSSPIDIFPRIDAWSVEQPVSEAEFLRREIGLDVQVASAGDLLARLSPTRPSVLVISEADPFRDLIHRAPPGSVIAFVISDEGYSDDRRELVGSSTAIRAVFRQYGLTSARITDITSSSAEFIRACRSSTVNPRLLAYMLGIGRRTRARMRAWNTVRPPVHEVPLGYTSEFARAFVSTLEHPHPDNASLFEIPRGTGSWRPVDITFRGSPSTPQRQALVEQARQHARDDVRWVDAAWSGVPARDRALTYVHDLLAATNALCPPGAVNTETFRYYEALVCGAQPVEPRTALTHLGRPIARGDDPKVRIRLALRRVRSTLAELTGGPYG